MLLGPGGACAVLPLDGVEVATALADGFGDGPVARAVGDAGAVVAYTRSAALLERLNERARRLIVHAPAPPPHGPHAAVWLAGAVAPLLGSPSPPAPSLAETPPLSFTDAEHREAEERTRPLPRRFLAVHPGSGSPSKNWRLDGFLEAARALAGGAAWLLVAGPAEAGLAPPEGALLAREWSLRVLGAALARAGLVLANDSGVAHLAAAAGAPTLALFGPTDPALWAPVGPWVAALRATGGDLAGIEPGAVVREGLRLRSAASGLPSG